MGPQVIALAGRSGVLRSAQSKREAPGLERKHPPPPGGWRWEMFEPRTQVSLGVGGTFREFSIWLGWQTDEGESRQFRKNYYSWLNPLGSQ